MCVRQILKLKNSSPMVSAFQSPKMVKCLSKFYSITSVLFYINTICKISYKFKQYFQKYISYQRITVPYSCVFFFLLKSKETCAMSYSYCNQDEFTRQETWQASVHLFKVRWNEHLVSYFSLMYRYGINTIILHLTFSRAEF